MSEQNFSAHLAVRLTEQGDVSRFTIKPTLDEAKAWASRTAGEDEKIPDNSDAFQTEESVNKKDSVFGQIIDRIVDVILSTYHLVGISSFVESSFLHAILNVKILRPMLSDADLLDSGQSWKIIGLNDNNVQDLIRKLDKLLKMQMGVSALPSSALMGLVATFDSLVAEIVKLILKNKGSNLSFGERTILVNDAIKFSTMDELIDYAITNEVYLLLRGSHSEQVDFIEKNFNINIKKDWERWGDFIEIFERRNLIAHGERFFTHRYASICQSNGSSHNVGAVGGEIKLDIKYMFNSIDVLGEFLLLFVFNVWRKIYRSQEDDALGTLNQVAFKFILEGRFAVSDRLLGFALSLRGARFSDVTRRMMIINRANSLKRLGKMDDCNDVLNSVDWSACEDRFKICVAAVKDDESEFVKLIPVVHLSKSVSIESFREWPVFDDMRSKEKVQETFLHIWGEPLYGKVGTATTSVRDSFLD